MYKSLEIHNFKHLFNFKLNGLSRVNIIAGKNNSGKSTILEALFLFIDPSVTTRSLAWRGIRQVSSTPEAMWGHLFPFYDTTKKIRISLDKHAMEIKQSNDFVPPRPPQNGIQTISHGGPAPSLEFRYYKKNKETGKVNIAASDGGVHIVKQSMPGIPVTYSSSLTQNLEEDANRFSSLDQCGRSDFLISALQQIIPELVGLSIGIHSNATMIQAELSTTKRKIPFALLGDGTVKLLNILLSIAAAENGIALIDEIENGFHYTVMPFIWKAIDNVSKDFNTQVFVTTHNYEMLKSLIDEEGEILEGVNYIRLDKTDDNEIKVVDFPTDVLASSLSSDWEIR